MTQKHSHPSQALDALRAYVTETHMMRGAVRSLISVMQKTETDIQKLSLFPLILEYLTAAEAEFIKRFEVEHTYSPIPSQTPT